MKANVKKSKKQNTVKLNGIEFIRQSGCLVPRYPIINTIDRFHTYSRKQIY